MNIDKNNILKVNPPYCFWDSWGEPDVFGSCPTCKKDIWESTSSEQCQYCGQKLDWSERK